MSAPPKSVEARHRGDGERTSGSRAHGRVKLNAMTSRQLVAFIESKLTANGLRKIVPTNTELAEAHGGFAHGRKAEAIIKRELAKLNGVTGPVPRDLKARVEDYLPRHPTVRWDEAVSEIVNGGAS